MAMKSYRELKPGGRYLRRFGIGEGSDVDPAELLEAANEAAILIDSHLQKTFSTSATPPIIRSIAEMLGSAIFVEYAAFAGDLDTEMSRPLYLRKKAGELLDMIKNHAIGVMNADGTWDSDYGQIPINAVALQGESRPVTIVPWLKWEQMAQPTGTTNDKDIIDDTDRQRYADEVVAAFAGSGYEK